MTRSGILLLLVCTTAAVQPAAAYGAAASVDQGDQGVAHLRQLSDGFTAVVARVKPAVVAIFTERELGESANPYQGTPFERFFGRPLPDNRVGQGSGVIVRLEDDYYILTNNHVIKNADQIRVQTHDDRHFEAEIVGADSLSDLAVLKVDADDLPSVKLGNSDELQVGEWVLAVGNPFGFEHTVTSGIVSALGRGRFGRDEYGSFIQTDAAINPGNSGGPLVNLDGEVVGINTAIVANNRASRGAGSVGLGFSIPANLTKNVLGQLVEFGEVRRGLLGIEIRAIDPTMADALGMDSTHGVMVRKVRRESAADKAGVESGDVIIALDGRPVRGVTDLRSRIGASMPGTRVELEVLRDENKKQITVVLDQLTEESLAIGESKSIANKKLGLSVQDMTPDLTRRLGYKGEQGVLVRDVRRGSDAARQGIRPGDLIQEVERTVVESVDDFIEAVDGIEEGDAILLLIRRGKETYFAALRVR